MVALQQELEAPARKESQLGKLYSFKLEKSRYRKNYIVWDSIERANKPKNFTEKTKHLAPHARSLLAVIVQKLERGERVLFNHKYISTITGRKRRQNQNIIQELAVVLDIKYHNSVAHNGKKYRYSYEFSYKKQIHSVEQNFARQDSLNASKQNLFSATIENKDIEYIRSSVQAHESNFYKNSKKATTKKTILANTRKKPTNQERKARIYSPKFKQYDKPKSLGAHYPLTTEECLELQNSSGRDFTQNAMNEILLDMSRKPKLQGHSFVSRARFMAYMATVYRYEGRDAVKTSNLSFKILARATETEVIAHTTQTQRDEFMATFEQAAIDFPTPENRFKAKIACTLPPMIGYNLLSSIRRVSFLNDVLEIHLTNQLNIDQHKQAILKEAKAVDCKIDGISVFKPNE